MKLTLASYQWQMKESKDSRDRAQALKAEGVEASDAFLRLCVSRGIQNLAQYQAATNQTPQLFHDPFLLYDMDKAVERIQEAIEAYESIVIYGDYDADGITSTLILYECLEAIGANVHYYLPNRLIDGYGPNTERWLSLAKEMEVGLFITVDNGIAGHEAIEAVKALGIDTIVSDHHELQETLPAAYAIIHPKHPQGTYPFKELSGAGVALKIVSALLGEVPEEALELAAIGTVADMVEMKDENRTIVLSGLGLMKDTPRPGLRLMLDGEKVAMDKLTTDTIGFIIGPRLNAIGRLGDPTPALQLLASLDDSEAATYLTEVNQANNERKAITQAIIEQVNQRMQAYTTLPNVIVEADATWPAGVLGIVASRLVKEYGRPAILFQYNSEEGFYKGSGRSVAAVNLFEALSEIKPFMKHFGGHSQAAGLTVEANQWDAFKSALTEAFAPFQRALAQPEPLDVDVMVEIDELTVEFADEIALLGPYGTGNPKPIVAILDRPVTDIKVIGQAQTHAKFRLTAADKGLQVLGFGMAERVKGVKEGDVLSVVGHVDINEWQGRRIPQLLMTDLGMKGRQWLDFRASQIHPDLLSLNDAVYVFTHRKVLNHMVSQLSSGRAILYDEQVEPFEEENLVIMEPPAKVSELKQLLSLSQANKIYLGAFVQASAYQAGLPKRDELVDLYKQVVALKGFDYRTTLPVLAQRLNLAPLKIKTMFLMFLEAKFVTMNDGWLQQAENLPTNKVDLLQLDAYQKYKYAYEAEALLNYQPLAVIKEYFEGK